MNNNYKKTIYHIAVIAFMLPAIIFWALFAYSGSELEGFLSFTGFLLDGYRDAPQVAKDTFVTSIRYGSILFLAFLSILIIILQIGRGGKSDECVS
jgi:hypothetical protein